MIDAFKVYSDSNPTMDGTLGGMLLGLDEITQARDTHAYNACMLTDHHASCRKGYITKMTQGSMVDAGAMHVPHVSRTSMI
jgi:hypothetical protein